MLRCKKQMYITYMSSQKTRRQKLDSYWIMNSLGDKLSTQQRYSPQSLKYKNMYACIINIYVPHEVKNLRASAKGTSFCVLFYGEYFTHPSYCM